MSWKERRAKIVERHTTIRVVVVCVTVAFVVWRVALAVEKILDTPPWLVIFGPTGTVVVLFSLYLGYLKFKASSTQRQIDKELSSEEKPVSETNESND